MRQPRKIIAYVATSADGYIARSDGDVEWLNRRPRNVDYGLRTLYRSIDTILLGRKTYDWGLDYYNKKGMKGSPFDAKMKNFVFSHNPPNAVVKGVEFVSEPNASFARIQSSCDSCDDRGRHPARRTTPSRRCASIVGVQEISRWRR